MRDFVRTSMPKTALAACEDTDHSYYCIAQPGAANAIPSYAYWLS